MSLWAIVPVKPLRRGKSRLAGVLSEDERTLLNFSMFRTTMEALTAVHSIQQVLVISRDPAALAVARECGARTVMEDSNSELNMALQRATIVAMMSGAHSTLVLPADLPLITSEKVQELIDQSDKPPQIMIAPDRLKEGTNALLMNPAGLIHYNFGPGSFRKHVEQAQKYKIRVNIFEDPTFGLDLDLPGDLELLRKMEGLPLESVVEPVG